MKRNLLAAGFVLWVGFGAQTAQAQVNICDRTPEVEAALLAAIGGGVACTAVTAEQLAGITGTLDLVSMSISSLQAGDFNGLSGLQELDLSFNDLSALPAGLFDELTALEELELGLNDLTTLPAGIFDELSSLRVLGLAINFLSTLSATVFDALANLEHLNLADNSLTAVPTGVFDQLVNLQSLSLQGNSLTTLPDGIFDRLASLLVLSLSYNSGLSLRAGVFDAVLDTLEGVEDATEGVANLNLLNTPYASSATLTVSGSVAADQSAAFTVTAARAGGATPVLLADVEVDYTITGVATTGVADTDPDTVGIQNTLRAAAGETTGVITLIPSATGDLTMTLTARRVLAGDGSVVMDPEEVDGVTKVEDALVNDVFPTASAMVSVRAAVVVTGLALSSAGADGVYIPGDVIEATVTFSTAVTVTGAPQLSLRIGAQTRPAVYHSGSGSAALVFRYTVAAEDSDDDGVGIAEDALALNGGGIVSSAMSDQAAYLGHAALPDSPSHRVNGRLRIEFDGAATRVGDEDYFIRPGTGARTRVATGGVSCALCATPPRAYEHTSACRGDPSQAGVDAAVCPPVNVDVGNAELLLGSFAREVLWAGVSTDGVELRAVQRFYVQPPVGFEVGAVRASADGSADLPVSVSVSGDVSGRFSVGVSVSGVSATLDESAAVAEITVPGVTASTPELTFSGTATADGALAPSGLDAAELFTLGSTGLRVIPAPSAVAFVPRAAVGAISADASSRQFLVDVNVVQPVAWTADANVLTRSATTPPLTATASENSPGEVAVTVTIPTGAVEAGDLMEVTLTATTADEVIATGGFLIPVASSGLSDDDGNLIPDDAQGDLAVHELPSGAGRRLSASGGGDVAVALGAWAYAASRGSGAYSSELSSSATAVGIGVPGGYAGTGVFDFSVSGVSAGGVVSVVIPLTEEAPAGVRLFKYDEGGWNPFTTGAGMADQYYGAALPCPASNAARGGGAGEWRAAGATGLRAGEACLLLEISDGGINDADGTVNGVVHDPNALGLSGSGRPGSPGGSAGPGGGGGALGWPWLLMLFLGLLPGLLAGRRATAGALRREGPGASCF